VSSIEPSVQYCRGSEALYALLRARAVLLAAVYSRQVIAAVTPLVARLVAMV
jgi:hypothetical protein